MRRRAALFATSVIIGAVCLSAAGDVPTAQLADSCEKKVVLVQKRAGTAPATPLVTPFSEGELNSWLKFKGTNQLPTGLTEPVLTLLSEGRVVGRAVVDLDIVRQKQSSGSWFDPTSYLTGKLQVNAVGFVKTGEGKGRFELERAEISGISMPKSLLGQMVNFFTRTADNPQGSNLDDTFELPADIRRIDVEQGRAVVVQ